MNIIVNIWKYQLIIDSIDIEWGKKSYRICCTTKKPVENEAVIGKSYFN